MPRPSTIAHYRITSKLGEGAMGAVYRATDTKLNREVAIKVLPPAFAEDATRMARFEREAQVLASLNHHNIAAIYGIEQNAIVMELVEGPDLKGPVPIETAIDYARQIATGLEAAHERGIVHRDLKPANMKVTPDGVVKLLDFGLAKATEQSTAASSAASPTISLTLSLAMTQAGMILGTAAYMSPEQARGKPVDRRADIWAFGVILYEQQPILLKEQLAAQLREAIMGGALSPGDRVIEGIWAKQFGTAQASVREAINILIGEGLLTKDSGRSARVTRYTESDVAALFQMRAAIEGLAAFLVTQQKAGVERMEQALDGMSRAIANADMRALTACDLEFHLSLIELSGNAFLIDAGKRLLIPLFAFILIRLLKSGQGPGAWEADLPRHRRIVELIKEGDPVIAEQYVKRSYRQFVGSAFAVWASHNGDGNYGRSSRRKKRPEIPDGD